MPHKRATCPAREREKARRATDFAPNVSIEHEPIPKSVARVLDAERIRREHRKKKKLDGVVDSGEGDNCQRKKRRQSAPGTTDDAVSPALRIMPSETVAHFNRRVEDSMMPLIKTALQRSSAQARRMRREEAAHEMLKQDKQPDKRRHSLSESSEKGSGVLPAVQADETGRPRNVSKEFQVVSTSVPRRLNDTAQEPPTFKRLPRGAQRNDAAPLGVLSVAQKAMMEEEREKAIKHYRELKARKWRESGGSQPDEGLDGSRTGELP